jgi:hypothetical protein
MQRAGRASVGAALCSELGVRRQMLCNTCLARRFPQMPQPLVGDRALVEPFPLQFGINRRRLLVPKVNWLSGRWDPWSFLGGRTIVLTLYIMIQLTGVKGLNETDKTNSGENLKGKGRESRLIEKENPVPDPRIRTSGN